jgi:hypothetical protein
MAGAGGGGGVGGKEIACVVDVNLTDGKIESSFDTFVDVLGFQYAI